MQIYKVARFFSVDVTKIEEMSFCKFIEMTSAMEAIQAQEVLVNLNIADYPHLKEESRAKFHKSISKRAFSEKEKVYSFDDIEKIFFNGG